MSDFLLIASKSTVILLAAWLASWLLRSRSAGLRHLVWTAGLCAVLVLPFLSLSLPALPAPDPGLVFSVNALAGTPVAQPAITAVAGAATPARWRPGWTSIWVAGTLISVAPLLVAWLALVRLRRKAPEHAEWDLAQVLARLIGLNRPVDLLSLPSGSMPMTAGVLRSWVFLPADAVEWSPERRRAVLLHELAHVRRYDVATHLLARLALALYWWHPLAWLAWRAFLAERERAADDMVINAGTRATEYAAHLLDLARKLRPAPRLAAAAVAMVRRRELESRLRSILASGVNRTNPGLAAVAVVALAVFGLAIPVAALQPPPEVEATIRAATSQKNTQMLEQAAAAFEKQRQYESAQKLLEASAALRAGISGDKSPEHGLVLLKLADVAKRRNQRAKAATLYGQAAEALGERPEAASALVQLGIGALVQKQHPEALEYFRHAQNVDPAHPGPALMWTAVVLDRTGKPDEADTYFARAISAQESNSSAKATTMQLYASFLRQRGRADEATRNEDQASAILKASWSRQTIDMRANRIDWTISRPTLVSKVEPAYSDEARAARLQGMVLLRIVIGTDGSVAGAVVQRPLGLGLEEMALDAVFQWRFGPAMRDGQPVPVEANVEINFRLL